MAAKNGPRKCNIVALEDRGRVPLETGKSNEMDSFHTSRKKNSPATI